MGIKIWIIDAFTKERFKGNPAAVCLLEHAVEEDQMKAIAAEMNLSETAFVSKEGDGFGLRWFTPVAEVELCGHATLAAAHVLWETGVLEQKEVATFFTKSGVLTARNDGEWIVLDFPSESPGAVQAPQELIEALGLIPRYVGRNRMDYLIEVDNEDTVRTLQPDFNLIKRLDARGVIVTSRANKGVDGNYSYDVVSRAFFPGIGIDEDPVTGSAHCALAPYWSKRLRKDELTGFQASARGGIVRMQLVDDRVLLSGAAVTVLRGELEVSN
ncbi:PhzF family phenazine biosynthesis protein [Paenibacillus sp. GSMTC-2017]|uniref:PhzF family phenazine biosynthesis protein n=1 Tax=Paenibacillus sp. GSMTC-2017 TaxID=2794350 RepID=UPI0018D82770|nr:PhzF family phenazine biosynthesis protein [Paenibacillus sp. GSMTC-2017]MBH5317010.1 PhzF family phenazine biosynthesis protein [Paenibacillus sp. GSMTC-2017]